MGSRKVKIKPVQIETDFKTKIKRKPAPRRMGSRKVKIKPVPIETDFNTKIEQKPVPRQIEPARSR